MAARNSSVKISVIIPTTAEDKRHKFLDQAIKSVFNQAFVGYEVVVVVNGIKCSETVLDSLRRIEKLKLVCVEEGNVSVARYQGLLESSGEVFCFLDDDDLLLPNSLGVRYQLLCDNPDVDVVVTNGYEQVGGQQYLFVDSLTEDEIRLDPLGSFCKQNWFASPAPMFRRSSLDDRFFKSKRQFFEWSYLFFDLVVSECSILYRDDVTYIKIEDNPYSISKTEAYLYAYLDFLSEIIKFDLSKEIKKTVLKKYVITLNERAAYCLERNSLYEAWENHLKCLRYGGWQYLLFTRKLIAKQLGF